MQHRQNDVPLLVGWNTQEGSATLMMGRKPLPDLLKGYYGAYAGTITPFYAAQSQDDVRAYIQAAGDNGIAYGTWKWAYAQVLTGHKPVYAYQFDHAPPLPAGAFGRNFDVRLAGAFHGAEIPYAFGTLSSRPTWAVSEIDRHIAATMSTYWANFIRTANPNGGGLSPWPRYSVSPRARRMRITAAHDHLDPADPCPPGEKR